MNQLFNAIYNGDLTEVSKILAKDPALVHAKHFNDVTPLIISSMRGAVEIMKLLISKGSDVNACDKDNSTPLHEAANSGHVEAVKLLLQSGANAAARNRFGDCPFHRAVWAGHLNVVRELVKAGVQPNVERLGRTVENALHIAADKGHADTLTYLVKECGLDVNSQTSNGDTALYKASSTSNTKVMVTLLDLNADPTIKNKQVLRLCFFFAPSPSLF